MQTLRSSWALALCMALLAVGAEGSEPGREASTSDAAIVSGADLVGRIDFGAMQSAPIVQKVEQAYKNERVRQVSEANRRFEEATGLKREDLHSIIFSANTGTFDATLPESKRLEKLDGVIAIALAKPLTLEQLTRGIQAMAADGPPPRISRKNLAGRTVLLVRPSMPEQNAAYLATSRDGATVFLTLSETSLAAALAREHSGRYQVASAPIVSAQASMPADSQLRFAFVVPELLRSQIRGGGLDNAKDNPSAAMMEGFLRNFQNIRSLSLAVGLSQDMALHLAGDLGDTESAQQAAMMIQTMLAPMLEAALESRGTPTAIAESFRVEPEGSSLRLGLRLSAEDLDSLGSSVDPAAAGR